MSKIPPDLSLTDTLCTRCGLCCDGSLFADVELATTDEASTLEIMGLEIEEDDDHDVLVQPCAALQEKRCSVYAHRPECCRTFECRLLQQTKRGAISVEQAKAKIAEALKQIERVKELIGQLQEGEERLPLMERCVEALARSGEVAADPGIIRTRTELRATMRSVEHLIQKTFLGG